MQFRHRKCVNKVKFKHRSLTLSFRVNNPMRCVYKQCIFCFQDRFTLYEIELRTKSATYVIMATRFKDSLHLRVHSNSCHDIILKNDLLYLQIFVIRLRVYVFSLTFDSVLSIQSVKCSSARHENDSPAAAEF